MNEDFLGKIKCENPGLHFLNFQDVGYGVYIGRHTRIKSFILKNYGEIAFKHWQYAPARIFDELQKIHDFDTNYLLEKQLYGNTRMPMFIDYPRKGYAETDCGLYLRRITGSNDILLVIKRIIEIFSIATKDAYLVVELTPSFQSYYYPESVKESRIKFETYLKDVCKLDDGEIKHKLDVLNELNEGLHRLSFTSYNDLYLLQIKDYDKYASSAAVMRIMMYDNNEDIRKESWDVINYLRECKAYYNEVEYTGHYYIEDRNSILEVTFDTHFGKEG